VKQPCGLLIPVWLLVVSIACLCRVIIATTHWRAWIARQKREHHRIRSEQRGAPRRGKIEKRLPLVPIISTTVAVVQIVFFTLVSTNTVSSRDGISPIVATMWFYPQQILNQFFTMKLIRLGRRIIPNTTKSNSQAGQAISSSGSTFNLEDQLKTLTHSDNLHRMLFVVWIISMFGEFLSALLTGLIQPAPSVGAFRAEFAFCFLLNAATVGSQIHQLSRVLEAIIEQTSKVMAINSNANNNIHEAIARLKFQRLVVICCAVPLLTLTLWIIASADFHWYLILVFCFLELSTLFFVSRSMRVKRQPNQSTTTSSTIGGNNANNRQLTAAGDNTVESPSQVVVSQRPASQTGRGGSVADISENVEPNSSNGKVEDV
jgi:hypothetical protein